MSTLNNFLVAAGFRAIDVKERELRVALLKMGYASGEIERVYHVAVCQSSTVVVF